jgi:hypothetical protein|tara:strand:+ start:789 stop:1193 length:405 start_codon:yes stop_codon:yes gene_type:complete
VYSLEEIYRQANEDSGSYRFSRRGKKVIIKLGFILNKYPSSIEILNTARGGDYYKELTKEEHTILSLNGWKLGILLVSMGNYLRKLNMIEERIKNEINTRKNDKHIQGLKTSREKILHLYSIRKQQIKNINEQF